MIKKISWLIISAAIMVAGYYALNRLNYWERSVRIFIIDNSDQRFKERQGGGAGRSEGRSDLREREGFERPDRPRDGFERPKGKELPDSIRRHIESEGGRQGMRGRSIQDSLRLQSGQSYNEDKLDRGSIESGFRDHRGNGRGNSYNTKKVNLRNVLWFLALFASFTVLAIYIDKGYHLIRKRKQR